jgi:hypothetical protein
MCVWVHCDTVSAVCVRVTLLCVCVCVPVRDKLGNWSKSDFTRKSVIIKLFTSKLLTFLIELS